MRLFLTDGGKGDVEDRVGKWKWRRECGGGSDGGEERRRG